ncbi:MAG: MATE family efflux transporter [Lachnospiraceae bacterium]|nr:MATE family efflux transporter [Lachnospiraceae bacterium]
MKTKEYKNNITEGVIWKQLLLFFFPLLFGTFFQQLYNTVDAVVVGQFVGKEALAEVGGASAMVINIFVGFFVGISSGATVTISQFFGGGRMREVRESIHTAVALSVTAGLGIMVIGLVSAPVLLSVMKTPPETMEGSILYLRIYFCGMVGNLIYNMGSGVLRAMGDSKRPLYFLIASCLVNVVLDIVLVAAAGLGVAGVAIATILSQAFSAVLVCITLLRFPEEYRLQPRNIRFHGWVLKRIIAIGIPAGFQSLMYSLSNALIQTNVNSFGTDTVAAWTAYSKIDALFWMVVSAFGISITTFVGQNYGAGLYQRVRKGVRQCFLITALFTLVLNVMIFSFGHLLFRLFTKDTAVIEIGIMMIRFLVPAFMTYICIEIYSGALRGMGDSLIPMLITCGGICGLRVVWLFIVVPKWNSMKTVMASYPITWVITSILFLIYYSWYTKKHDIR